MIAMPLEKIPPVIEESNYEVIDHLAIVKDSYVIDLIKLYGAYVELEDYDYVYLCSEHSDHPLIRELLLPYALMSPYRAFAYERYIDQSNEDILNLIATQSYYSSRVASRTGERFEAAEPNIASVPMYAYEYARDVLKGRFELGEQIIATHADYSYYYALEVIEGRFKLGEHTILDSEYAFPYMKRYLPIRYVVSKIISFITKPFK